jgi:hypothetical protein
MSRKACYTQKGISKLNIGMISIELTLDVESKLSSNWQQMDEEIK